jgi:hypothetical protein
MNKNFLVWILAITLVFGITTFGCDNNPDDGKGPQWVAATGDDAKPFDGSLSNDGKTITIPDYPFVDSAVNKDGNGNDNSDSDPIIFTRSGSGNSLDGVYYAEDSYLRMTISGNNWTLAFLDNGNYIDAAKGTLSRNGTAVTLTATHIMDFGEDDGPPSGGSGPPENKLLIVQLQTETFSQYEDGVFSISQGDNEKTSGVIGIIFIKGGGLTVSELSWLTTNSFSLSFDIGDRTLSINSIEKQQSGNYGNEVLVILSCTRSAGYSDENDAQTATLSITAGGGFTLHNSSMQLIF